MIEDYNFIRASLLLRAGRKQNFDLPLFVCVRVFCPLEKSLSIYGSGLNTLEPSRWQLYCFSRIVFLDKI